MILNKELAVAINCSTQIVAKTPNYYPCLAGRQAFGMMMADRQWSSESGYRFGFQGQERDDEIKGSGNSINYKYRMHDSRIGRFFAVDPLCKDYPWNSPYAFSENRLIDAVELEGLEAFLIHGMLGNPESNSIYGSNRTIANALLERYSNSSVTNDEFAWNIGRSISSEGVRTGRKLNRLTQKVEDRTIAAKLLVDHVLQTRKEMIEDGTIEESEDITLLGFSAGGLVALQAAAMLAEEGYTVNIILVNTSPILDKSSPENPENALGVNDMLIVTTANDKLFNKLPGSGKSYNDLSIDDRFEIIEVNSTTSIPLLNHFAKYIDIESLPPIETSNRLDRVSQ